jgi:integrase
MKGGIYSDERCPVCNGVFKNTGKALVCIEHNIKATRFKVLFRGLCKRFRCYDDADRFLTGVRYETDIGKYDVKDYRRDNPLAFDNISEKYLEAKKGEVKLGSHKAIVNHLRYAQKFFGNTNVKDIKYGLMEDFFKSLSVSGKTKHNIKTTLHSFFIWVSKREERDIMPAFPVISYDLGYRNTVSKEDQIKILDEIKRISYGVNPKIYLGIKWLCTYISIRPGEMVSLIEENIDLKNKYLYFPNPKEKKYKSVPILDEDVRILEGFNKSFPKMKFFRYGKGVRGHKENESFGREYFYKWWKKACRNLGIEGIDLYGGTRHSSARALRKYRTPEEIRRATMHSTNKAFERYFNMESDDLRSIYKDTGKVIKIDESKERKF